MMGMMAVMGMVVVMVMVMVMVMMSNADNTNAFSVDRRFWRGFIRDWCI